MRHIFLLETENDRDEMFVINVNGTELHFGLKEFIAIIGLKFEPLSDFILDSSISIRLIQEYFEDMNKVPKLDFYHKFKLKFFWEDDDLLKIEILYFISSFLTASEP